MANTSATDREQQAREYLETARSLVNELERAMLAICRNELSDLEESLTEQEILTARLKSLQRQRWVRNDVHPARHPAIVQPDLDTELAKEVVVVDAELQGVNRVYEVVLRHSSHSASLMASLLDSFKGHFQEASGPRRKYQTWSCQM
jgi:flagellar biosynthesis/type III secretory pathway chaperone